MNEKWIIERRVRDDDLDIWHWKKNKIHSTSRDAIRNPLPVNFGDSLQNFHLLCEAYDQNLDIWGRAINPWKSQQRVWPNASRDFTNVRATLIFSTSFRYSCDVFSFREKRNIVISTHLVRIFGIFRVFPKWWFHQKLRSGAKLALRKRNCLLNLQL